MDWFSDSDDSASVQAEEGVEEEFQEDAPVISHVAPTETEIGPVMHQMSKDLERDFLPPFLLGGTEERRRKIDRMMSQNPCGLIVTDALEESNPIIYVNNIFERITGYTAEDILGRNCRFLQYRGAFAHRRHPLVNPSTVARMRQCLEEGREFQGEILNFRKDGSPLVNRICIMPICGQAGLVTHFIGIQSFSEARLELGPLPSPPWKQQPQKWQAPLSVKGASSSAGAQTGGSMGEGSSKRRSDPQFAGVAGCGIMGLSDEVLGQQVFSRVGPRDLACLSMVSRRFHRVADNDSVWAAVCATQWGQGTAAALGQVAARRRLRWGRVAREISTLEAAAWRKLTVKGAVEPYRCNFSACAVGTKLVLFGGEGANMQPLNDTFVLDLGSDAPEWRAVHVGSAPPGRWGHTLSSLNSSALVVFGGCGAEGLLNDVFILDLDAEEPTWKEVAGRETVTGGGEGEAGGGQRPRPRSWHSSCTLDGSKLVVFGGCTDSGRLLSDTFLLDLDAEKPAWREIPVSWSPPSRLGHSLSPYGDRKILMFGGLATSGPLRLRSSDAFTIDLSEDSPSWRYVTGSTLPGGATAAGTAPPPRLDHVAFGIAGGRVLIFGGSIAGLNSPSQVYLLDPGAEKPMWRVLDLPGQKPNFAWGHSTCVMGGSRAVVLGGQTGEEWILNELHELSLLSVPAAAEIGAGDDDDSSGKAEKNEEEM